MIKIDSFHSLGLHEAILQSLAKMQFHQPTEIQAKAIPLALEGRDLIATSQTGTGKTMAYAIPALSHVYKAFANSQPCTILIITPTRELATQAFNAFKMIRGKIPVRMASLIGGEPMFKQYSDLKRNPEIVIGTPGRINDHLRRKSLRLQNTGLFILDEFDRMLDMNFEEELKSIARCLPNEHQTLMFSATMGKDIARKAEDYLHDAVRISVGSTTSPIEKISQHVIHLAEADKYHHLIQHLEKSDGKSIVFVKTKIRADQLANQLNRQGHEVECIHGDLRQRIRERAIKKFRERKDLRILIGTDVLARGLDIPDIEWVINYDLPQRSEDYIHRIGRTGRAGATGQAISYVSRQEKRQWQEINRLINPGQPEEKGASRSNAKSAGQKRHHFKSKEGFQSKTERPHHSRRKPNQSQGSAEKFGNTFKKKNTFRRFNDGA